MIAQSTAQIRCKSSNLPIQDAVKQTFLRLKTKRLFSYPSCSSLLTGRQTHDPTEAVGRKRKAENAETSQGNVSTYYVLAMVDSATWRLKITGEPGFLLKTKRVSD